ncbi:CHAT domain-containing protein [Streptomyces sp. 4N509B]|uniref:CHAT domain-containing protein n=1 Tax=Streptomyces sp. 4N509B TaxID=3457413 RepID=UPI003FD4D329
MHDQRRLSALRRRVARYEAGGRDAVVGPRAAAEAEDLRAALAFFAAPADPDALTVLAWFYWYRSQEVAERQAYEEAVRAAAELFFAARDLAPETPMPPVMEQLYAARATASRLDPPSAGAFARDAARSGDPGAIEWAVTVLGQAEKLARDAGADVDSVVYQGLGAQQLTALYERLGRPEDLDLSVALLSDAMRQRHALDDYPETVAMLRGYLGRALLLRHQLHGRAEDLTAAVVELRGAHEVFDRLGPEDPEWLGPAHNLGAALLAAGEHREAAVLLARVRAVHPEGSLEAAQTSLMLGNACHTLHLRHGRRQDLEECVRAFRACYATPLTTPGFTELRADVGQRLAAALHDLSLVDGDGGGRHLAEAARVVRECLASEPEAAARLRLLVRKGQVHYASFQHAGNVDELDAVVGAADEVVRHADASPAVDWASAIRPTLVHALCDRFRLTSDRRDLDRAVAEARRGGLESASDLLFLSHALVLRSETTGSRDDADRAVEAIGEALALLPAESPQRGQAHSLLGDVFRAKGGMFGDVADLDAAVDAYREAGRAQDASHFTLSGFASVLLVRFQHRGAMTDIEEAVTLSRAAVQAAPTHDQHGPLNLTGVALRLRFGRSGALGDPGDPGDLDEAIEAGQAAVRAVPAGHTLRPTYLANLAMAHIDRFRERRAASDAEAVGAVGAAEVAEAAGDVDAAIGLLREAVDTVPPGHRLRPGLLTGLAGALADRFDTTSGLGDLQAALDHAADALDECPPGRAERAVLQMLRGRLLLRRRELRPGEETAADLAAATTALREVADSATAQPRSRMTALRTLAEQATEPAAALAAYERAVEFVPLIAWHGLDRRDREHFLAWIGALPQEAAAAALDAGRPERAVELLEHGRAVLWSQSLQTDLDLAAVRRHSPDVAQRLERVRDRLQALDALGDPDPAHLASVDRAGASDTRVALAREWEELCEHVRRDVPGCEDFLRPPDFAQLRAAAEGGTVVLVNIAERRSDALALTADGLRVIPLPGLRPRLAHDQVSTWMAALESFQYLDVLHALGDGEGQLDMVTRMVRESLDWLWDAVAAPVLDALGHTAEPAAGDAWPRVWWCPTGPLTFLPFHAAGRYLAEARAGECVLDRVVSSHVPTLRTLVQARGRTSGVAPDKRRMLVVAMPQTPGSAPLPDAEEDIASVTAVFPDRTTVVAGPEATRDAVRRAQHEHSWVHFSCHGDMDPLNPSRSGLLLHDGVLTVADQAGLRLGHAEFAFLASCSTALSGWVLPDEAVHISTALQFSGYRHVVATMWPVLGRYAGFVADHLYGSLAANGVLAAEESALALHDAVRALRARSDGEVAVWIPFVHSGP